MNIDAPSGTRIEVTDHYARRSRTEVVGAARPEGLRTSVGGRRPATDFGGSRLPVAPRRLVTMEFVDMEDRSRLLARVPREICASAWPASPGARITVDKMEEGPPTGTPVNIEISGRRLRRPGRIWPIRSRSGSATSPVWWTSPTTTTAPCPRSRVQPGRRQGRPLRPADLRHRRHHPHGPARRRNGQVPGGRGRIRHRRPLPAAFPAARWRTWRTPTVFYEGKTIPAVRLRQHRVRDRAGRDPPHRRPARGHRQRRCRPPGYNANALLAEVQQTLADFDAAAGLHHRLHRRERGPGGGLGLPERRLRRSPSC